MAILIIDTANKYLSIALIDIEGGKLSAFLSPTELSHAKSITRAIETICDEGNQRLNNLSAIAMNRGPGSFTGLRVGSSVAKGLCFGLDIPLIAVDGLEAYANYYYKHFGEHYTDVFILLDARRDNYFYSHVQKGRVVKKTAFSSWEAIQKEIKSCPRPWVYCSQKEEDNKLLSEYLAYEVIQKWKQQEWSNITSFEPNYMLNNYQKKS